MTVLSFDPERPLDICKGENKAANFALQDYYRMGPMRSLKNLFEAYRAQEEIPPTRRLATLAKWSTANRWQERVGTAEKLDKLAVERAKQAALEAEARLWAERRIQVREKDWTQAERLRLLAEQMLIEGPEYIKTWEIFDQVSGQKVVHHAFDAKLLVGAIKTASDIQRRAAEMETEHVLSETVPAQDMDELRTRRWQEVQAALGEALANEDQQEEPKDELNNA